MNFKKKIEKGKITVTVWACLLTAITLGFTHETQGQWVTLHGTVQGDQVKLYWETHDWPEDLYGFNIKRRSKANGGEWIELNQVPVSPAFAKDKNWEVLGLNAEQTREIKGKFDEYLEDGHLSIIDNGQMLQILKSVGGLKSGDRLRMKNDFDFTLMAGFGYIDNYYDEKKLHEYAIFFVQDDGNERPEPLSVYQPQDFDDLQVAIQLSRLNNGIGMNWEMDGVKAKSIGLYGFNVYRKSKKRDDFELLAEGFSGAIQEEGLIWKYMDTEADNTKDYIYAIAPVNMFQAELKQFEKEYKASEFEPLDAPAIDELGLVNAIDVQLKWETLKKKSLRERIQGYHIQRTEVVVNKYENITDLLTADNQEYIDEGLKKYGKTYLYRLVLVDTQGKTWYGPEKRMLYLGELKPLAPKNAKAEYKQVRQKDFIIVSWDPKDEQDTLTMGYRLFADGLKAGELLQLASVPLIKGSKYEYEVPSGGGRYYKFKVVPVSHDQALGEAAEMKCYVGTLDMPAINEFRAELMSGKRVKLIWSYPDIPDMIGFRVYMNGKVMANEEEVGADMKEWIISKPVAGADDIVKFQVEAVGKLATRKSINRSLLLSGMGAQSEVEPPANLKVKFDKKEGEEFATLTWDKVNMKEKDILGYVLYVDETKEGIVMRKSSLPLIKDSEFKYKLPDDKRKKYTFRVAAMDKDRKISPYSEASLDKSKKQKSEDK